MLWLMKTICHIPEHFTAGDSLVWCQPVSDALLQSLGVSPSSFDGLIMQLALSCPTGCHLCDGQRDGSGDFVYEMISLFGFKIISHCWNEGNCSMFFDRVFGINIGDLCYDHDAAYTACTVALKIKGDWRLYLLVTSSL